MKEAIGGTVTIAIIIVFLLLINGYLAFSVNYTKAFRVKNEIISLIEQHEGHTQSAQEEIQAYLRKIHYTEISDQYFNNVEDGYTCYRGFGYCIKYTNAGGTSSKDETFRGTYYSVITFVQIDIPILNRIFPLMNIFQVKGETKMIYSSGTDSGLET